MAPHLTRAARLAQRERILLDYERGHLDLEDATLNLRMLDGPEPPPPDVTPEWLEFLHRIQTLRARGLTYHDIGQHVGRAPSTVWRILTT